MTGRLGDLRLHDTERDRGLAEEDRESVATIAANWYREPSVWITHRGAGDETDRERPRPIR